MGIAVARGFSTLPRVPDFEASASLAGIPAFAGRPPVFEFSWIDLTNELQPSRIRINPGSTATYIVRPITAARTNWVFRQNLERKCLPRTELPESGGELCKLSEAFCGAPRSNDSA